MAAKKEALWKRYWWAIALAIVVLIALMLVGMYNSFVNMRTNVDGKWANVEAQYQRRADLIPNLVTVTSEYANYEKSTLTEITELRSQWASARSSGDREAQMAAANEMDSLISRLLLVAENYPQLRASETFRALQDELAGTENRVAVARMDYNNAVRDYNRAIKSFPGVMFAGMFGFSEEAYFEAAEGTEQAPAVEMQID